MMIQHALSALLTFNQPPADAIELEVHMSEDARMLFDVMPEALQTRLTETLADRERREDSEPVAIVVDVERSKNSLILFRATINVPERREIMPAVVECDCKTDEFIDAVVTDVVRLASEAAESEEELGPTTLGTGKPTPSVASTQPGLDVEPKEQRRNDAVKRERVMIGAGAAVITLGLGATITGAVIVGKGRAASLEWSYSPETQDLRSGEEKIASTRVQGAGVGVLVAGVALAATGSALLGIGLKRRKDQVDISLTPKGLLIRGRF